MVGMKAHSPCGLLVGMPKCLPSWEALLELVSLRRMVSHVMIAIIYYLITVKECQVRRLKTLQQRYIFRVKFVTFGDSPA
jgi:hypothetical protein